MAESKTETTTSSSLHSVDANVQELLALAERLREQNGGELDDAALSAVAEATGAPLEYVRVAMLRPTVAAQPRGFFQKMRHMVLSFDPSARLYITCVYLACIGAFLGMLSSALRDPGQFFVILSLATAFAAAYFASATRTKENAGIAGAIYGGVFFVGSALFTTIASWIISKPMHGPPPPVLFVFAGVGWVGGQIVWQCRNRRKPGRPQGLVDPTTTDRQRLLAQLVELQDKLRAGEQNIAFLSLDVVGSTKMKEFADPLAVEFTFTEYHRYVETVTLKHGGRIHSTAGDGMICAFDTPQQAFNAARNIQSGLIELNTHRNRIGTPIALRSGVHYGSVVPTGSGIQSVNFAHVIDIAAHLQKECPEGGVAVSESAAKLLVGGLDAVGSQEVQVFNTKARVWHAATRPLPASAAPPQFLPDTPTSGN